MKTEITKKTWFPSYYYFVYFVKSMVISEGGRGGVCPLLKKFYIGGPRNRLQLSNMATAKLDRSVTP